MKVREVDGGKKDCCFVSFDRLDFRVRIVERRGTTSKVSGGGNGERD